MFARRTSRPAVKSGRLESVRVPLETLRESLRDRSELSTFFDPDEDPDDIEKIVLVVPSEFHDLLDVFSKAKAEKLPPHRSYDHTIDLIDEGNLPPVVPIYSTSPD